jgi:hypothetical protein
MTTVLGKGKEGRVSVISRDGVDVASKDLTTYGKDWLFMVRVFIEAEVESKHLSPVSIVDSRFLEYPFEPLTHIPHSDTYGYFEQIITMEQDLLKHGLLFWDFGGVKGYEQNNYMKNEEGIVRWIDYGGNVILCLPAARGLALKRIMYETPSIADRHCLVCPSKDFIRLAILYHACFGVEVNSPRMLSIGTSIQKDPTIHAAAYETFTYMLSGTSWERLAGSLREIDVATVEGWEDMRSLL